MPNAYAQTVQPIGNADTWSMDTPSISSQGVGMGRVNLLFPAALLAFVAMCLCACQSAPKRPLYTPGPITVSIEPKGL